MSISEIIGSIVAVRDVAERTTADKKWRSANASGLCRLQNLESFR